MTMTGGETLIIDHGAETLEALIDDLSRRSFLACGEIRASGSQPRRDIIIAAAQVTLVRPLVEGASQGSSFRPKR